MKKVSVAGLAVGRLCLGSGFMLHGDQEEDCYRLLDAFVEGGGTLVDTGRVYGDAEAIIGRYLKKTHAPLQVLTKGAHFDPRDPATPRVTPEAIAADSRLSLDLLGRPFDLYMLHRDNPAAPVGPLVEALNALGPAGICSRYGVSNWATARIAEANAYAQAQGLVPLCASQVLYSYARHNDVPPTFQDCTHFEEGDGEFYRSQRMTTFAYSSQAGGYFDKLASGRPVSGELTRIYGGPVNARRLEALRVIASRHAVPVGAVALSFLLNQPHPVVAIVGCHTLEQLQSSLAAERLELAPEEQAELAAL